MGSSDVTLGIAFVAGLISFISPCVLPLVPAYIGYMGGRMTQNAAGSGQGLRQRFGTFIHGLFFVLGFTLFFVIFGLLTTAAVSSLTALGVTENDVTEGIARVGGTAVILFGLHVMGLLNRAFTWLSKRADALDQNPYGNLISALVGLALIGAAYWLFMESWFLTLVVVLIFTQIFRGALKADTPSQFWKQILTTIQTALYVDTRRQSQPKHQYGYLGSLFMGVVFSAGWTPCIGPIYGAVLTLASSGGSVSEAGTLLTAYSLGLGIPFLLTALALDQAQGVLRGLQRNMRTIEAVSGAFLILIGVLVFSGQLERIAQLGNQGRMGEISANLEHCVVGATEGKVHWSNVVSCIDDGPKEDFYVAVSKNRLAPADPQTDANTEAAEASPLGEDLGAAPLGTDLDAAPLGSDLGAAGNPAPDNAPSSNAPEGLDVGERAPDFTTTGLDGQTVSLSDFRGQPVLINFWATWCVACRKEMPDFQTIYDIYGSDGFVILAVNYQESPAAVRDYVDEMELSFPVLLDESGTINDDLFGENIPGYPTSFLLDADGVIAAYFPGEVEGADLLDALTPLLN